MQIIMNRAGPGFPRRDVEGNLDKFIASTAEHYIILFWNQEELDFFNAYCLMRGVQFPLARLWIHRPFPHERGSDYVWVFVRIPNIRQRTLP